MVLKVWPMDQQQQLYLELVKNGMFQAPAQNY